jgi:hypothetical protein
MDLRGRRHYVGAAMEFLLILSAVLSTVTGAFSAGRAPDARPHQSAAQVVAVAAPIAGQAVALAPRAIPAPRQTRTPIVPASRAASLAAAIPLYADRLIE